MFVAFAFPFLSFAQDVELRGVVKDYNTSKKLTGAIVTVYENGTQVEKAITSSSGKFDFQLRFDTQYKIVTSGSGMVAKTILIDTRNIPPEEKEKGGFLIPMEMTLFDEMEGLDFSIMDEPIGKFFYDPEMNDIIHDAAYTADIQNQIKALMKEYKRKMKEAEQDTGKDAEQLAKEAAERLAKIQTEFDRHMEKGDEAVQKEEVAGYEEAVSWYGKAVTLVPDHAEAKAALKDAEKLLREEKERLIRENAEKEARAALDAKYKRLIAEGDKLAKEETRWKDAIDQYKAASDLKPEEDYPRLKIKALDQAIAMKKAEVEVMAELDAEFNQYLKDGDQKLEAKEYENAIALFQKAANMRPEERVPKEKLENARKLWNAEKDEMKRLAKVESEYQRWVAAADAEMTAGNYDNAIKTFRKASDLKPEEEYPKTKIKALQNLLAAEKAEADRLANVNAGYQQAVQNGDRFFKEEKWEDALAAYREAKNIKPNETYPSARIEAVHQKMAEQKAAAEVLAAKEQAYKDAIAKADGLMNGKEFENALAGYQEALELKPSDVYAKTQIQETQKAIANLNAYNEFVAAGDRALNKEEYSAAKTAYEKALGLFSNEAYPKEKIGEIEGKLAAIEAEKNAADKLITDYQAAVKEGDQAMRARDLAAAKRAFEKAQGLQPAEEYPGKQIAIIDKTLADEAAEAATLAAKTEQYKDLIAKADAHRDEARYNQAITAYQEASELMPEEVYPKNEIKAARNSINAMANYDQLLATGDQALKAEDLSSARAAFEAALSIKPGDAYATGKMKEITDRMAVLAAEKDREAKLENDYQTAIKEGDAYFKSEDFNAAKTAFEKAGGLKPDAPYPAERLRKIEQFLKDAAAARLLEEQNNAKYQEWIATADALFNNREMTAAISAYKEALAVIPGKTYPKDQIKKAEDSLEALARYDHLIQTGNDAFAAQDYSSAKSAFEKALEVQPGEQYPAAKIREIDEIRDLLTAEQDTEAQLKADYKAAMKAGDNAAKNKAYGDALAAYQSAAGLRPDESLPGKKIREVQAIIDQMKADEKVLAAEEEAYNKWIAEADRLFQSKEYQVAIPLYEAAFKAKPALPYPYDQIKACHAALSEKARLEQEEADRLTREKREQEEADHLAQVEAARLAKEEEERKRREEAERQAKEIVIQKEAQHLGSTNSRSELKADALMYQALLKDEADKYEHIKKIKAEKKAFDVALINEAENDRLQAVEKIKAERREQLEQRDEGKADRLESIAEVEAFSDHHRVWLAEKNTTGYHHLKEVQKNLDAFEEETRNVLQGRRELRLQYADDVRRELDDHQAWTVEKNRKDDMDLRRTEAALDRFEKEVIEALAARDNQRQKYVRKIREAQEVNLNTLAEYNQSQEARRTDNYKDINALQADRSEKYATFNHNRDGIYDGIDRKKKDLAETEKERIISSDVNRKKKKAALDKTVFAAPKSYDAYFLNQLAIDYPQGVSEEHYNQSNKIIVRRIVVQGNKADDYRKMVAKWGTYYFKNGRSISQADWTRETAGK